MPPFIPQKRRHSQTSPSVQRRNRATRSFDNTGSVAKPHTLQDNKDFLDTLGPSHDESSLSEISSDDFEDALPRPVPKNIKTDHEVEDEDAIHWENVIETHHPAVVHHSALEPSETLQITLKKNVTSSNFANPYDKRKGPSKIERQMRTAIHCMHVQCLLFHNLIRNGWACDGETQRILLSQLPSTVRREIDKWRLAAGFNLPSEEEKISIRRSQKGSPAARKAMQKRNQRDWGRPAERQEKGTSDLSHRDPLLRLLKVLAIYWKKWFVIAAPGLRKQGYKPLRVLEEELATWRENSESVEAHGERVESLAVFRECARTCEGSKDVGAQLFTALIRGVGIDARLVASLQPLGYGWTKGEEAIIKAHSTEKGSKKIVTDLKPNSDSDILTTEGKGLSGVSKPWVKQKHPSFTTLRSQRGAKASPIYADKDHSTGEGSERPEETENDDDSVMDVTPKTPRRKPNRKYDHDMPAPTYWVEAISPLTNEVYPVDPFVLNPPVATTPEHIAQLETRGVKADQAKQVFAYIVAYSNDGSAKDVTTRYLKRHLWPGRTKGVRMATEKIPIYNRNGKVKRHKQYDWFRRVMCGYERHHALRTVTDDLEDAKDLKPTQPPSKDAKAGDETLQGFKSSAEFVLERHLRREEALRPDAKPIKTFIVGKGGNQSEEPVYLRKDVEICRTSESWHKEGRAVKAGEQPMKTVPVRAVTANRKREVEEAERDGGGKLMQGMYAKGQTDWIIPDPIKDGIIPKNAYGNIDCFVPSMVPKGAVHIPFRSTGKVCKRLGIDFAEAVTGFEFGHRMAVPVLTGVVVAKENEDAIIKAWEHDEEERRIKEEGKREKQALGRWRKWMLSLRVLERVREEYGEHIESDLLEEVNPFINKNKMKGNMQDSITDMGPGAAARECSASGESAFEINSFQDDSILSGGGFLLNDEKDNEALTSTELTLEVDENVQDSELSVSEPHNSLNVARDRSGQITRSQKFLSPPRRPTELKRNVASKSKPPPMERANKVCQKAASEVNGLIDVTPCSIRRSTRKVASLGSAESSHGEFEIRRLDQETTVEAESEDKDPDYISSSGKTSFEGRVTRVQSLKDMARRGRPGKSI